MKIKICPVCNRVIWMITYTSKTQVPENRPEFDAYVSSTDDHQNDDQEGITPAIPVWKRLGWTTTDNTAWSDKRSDWDDLFAKYNNPAQSTTIIKDRVTKFIADFHVFARPFLKKITSCGTATDEDAKIFHVVLERADPTHTHTKIKDAITGIFSDVAPGIIDIKAMWNTEAKKASLAEGASHVEYSWEFVPLDEKGEPEGSPILKAMIAPTADFKVKLSTKAKFEVDFGAANSGKWIILFLRWYVDTNEKLSSNYSKGNLQRIP